MPIFPDVTVPGWLLGQKDVEEMLEILTVYTNECGENEKTAKYKQQLLALLSVHLRAEFTMDDDLMINVDIKPTH